MKEDIEKHSAQDLISEVVVPAETVVEIKRGKKVDVERKVCPGYILIKMDLNDKSMQMIRSITGVAKFLGRNKKPMPIPEQEVITMFNHIRNINTTNSQLTDILYSPGDLVRITEGAFEGFKAHVESVDIEKMRLKVAVSIFGRETNVEIDFKQASREYDEVN